MTPDPFAPPSRRTQPASDEGAEAPRKAKRSRKATGATKTPQPASEQPDEGAEAEVEPTGEDGA